MKRRTSEPKPLRTTGRDALEAIIAYRAREGVMPSVDDLKDELNISKTAAYSRLQTLERGGWIRLTGEARGIEVIFEPPPRGEAGAIVPIHGHVAAGSPLLVVEQPAELVDMPNLSAPMPGHGYLRVRGSSMVNDHILDGDLVLIRLQESVDNGEIAVVLIEEQTLTLKRFYKERGRKVRLEPASDRHETQIYKADQVRVRGKFVGLYRPASH
jgi:repressor LexA